MHSHRLHSVDCIRLCFGTVCDFLFVCEISLEPLNGFALNSQGRRVWSLAWMSLNVNGQGHHREKSGVFGGYYRNRLSVLC